MTPAALLTGDPLDRPHPLARGLAGFWLALPNLQGSRLFDYAGGSHGTLTGATWTAGANGFGSVQFTASSQYVRIDLPTAVQFNPSTTPFTFACSAGTSVNTGTQFAASLTATTEGGGVSVSLGQRGGGAWKAEGYGNGPPSLTGTTTPSADGRLYSVLYSWDGTTGRLWVDGQPENSNSSTPQNGTLQYLWLGRFSFDYDQWTGRVAHAALWPGRVIDGAAWGEQVRRGFPDLLRRTRRRPAAFTGASPPPPPPPSYFLPAVAGLGW